MGRGGQFINPASRNLSAKSNPEDAARDSFPIFIGEVVDVNYSSARSGIIRFRSKHTKNVSIEQVTSEALPFLSNIKSYPVKGELVLIFFFGSSYYLPLNILNNVATNAIPFNFPISGAEQETEYSKIHLANKTFDLDTDSTIPTAMNEGDIVYEGRFGQSIKFGSTVKFNNIPQTLYSISDLSENGDPITIIRNGIKEPSEDVLKDETSIYLCSTQRIQIDNNDNGFTGITGEWSTINVSSETYDVILSDVEEQPEDTPEQFQVPPTATNDPGLSTNEITPTNADLSTLDKLPGMYEAYQYGKSTGNIELYVVDGVPLAASMVNPFLTLKAAAAADGVTIVLNSGFRTMEDIVMPSGRKLKGQKTLYAEYQAGTGELAAPPGRSNHQHGSAIDTNARTDPQAYKWLVQNAIKYGFVRWVPKERHHWEYRPTSTSIYANVPKSHPTWDNFNDGMT